MAQVTVAIGERLYTIDNGMNKNVSKIDNVGGTSQRTYHMGMVSVDIDLLIYKVEFTEKDTIEAYNYESPVFKDGEIEIEGTINASWIGDEIVNIRLIKIDAINKLFLSNLGIEPLNADGTVKPEYQTTPPPTGNLPTSMTKTTVLGVNNVVMGGRALNYIKYVPNVASDLWVIWLHGNGEDGPLDGSAINRVLNLGLPKNAESGRVYNFNLIAPQMENNNWYPWGTSLIDYIKTTYGATKICVIGYSQGGIGVTQFMDLVKPSGNMDFSINISGWFYHENWDNYETIPGIHYHGTKDTTVNYSVGESRTASYNAVHGDVIDFNLAGTEWIWDGKGHGIVNAVCDPNANAGTDISQAELDIYNFFGITSPY